MMRVEDFWIDVVVFVVSGKFKDQKAFSNFVALPFGFTEEEAKKKIMANDLSIQSIENIDEWADCLLLKEQGQ